MSRLFFFISEWFGGIFERQIYRVDKTTLKEEADIKT